MTLRYYLTLTAAAVLSFFSGILFAFFTDRLDLIPLILSIDVIALVFVNLAGGHVIFKPVRQLLQGGDFKPVTERRIRALAKLSAIWVVALVMLRWAMMILATVLELPEGGLSEPANRVRIVSDLWWMALSAVYYPVLIYFAISDYVSDLRRKLFEDRGINLKPRGARMQTELMAVFLVLVLLPLITVLMDVQLFEPARAAYGFDLVSHISFDVITALVVVVIAVFFVIRDLTRPIVSLSEAVARVRAGDLERHYPVTTDDEIGRLASDFNELIDDVREREFIKQTFGKYVPPSIVPKILADKGRLSGEVRLATIFFSDIENFTTSVEDMTPSQTIDMLNAYFSEVLDPIRKRGGVINALIGDAIFAAFNVPLDDDDHAQMAIEAAIEIQQMTRNRTFAGQRLRTRVGINTGNVVAGSVGSSDRMGFTLLGDEVNIAARLEQMNKELNSYILVSDNTYKLAKNFFEFEAAGERSVKGKRERVAVYKVIH